MKLNKYKLLNLSLPIWIIIGASCLNCANVPYTCRQKLAFGAFVVAAGADMYTTRQMLGDGFEECNPLMDSHPDDAQIVAFNAVSLAGLYVLGEIWPEQRETIWWLAALIRGGLAVHNWRLGIRH